MDELDLIRAFRRDEATSSPVARQAARERLLAHISDARPAADAMPAPPRTQPARASTRRAPIRHVSLRRVSACLSVGLALMIGASLGASSLAIVGDAQAAPPCNRWGEPIPDAARPKTRCSTPSGRPPAISPLAMGRV